MSTFVGITSVNTLNSVYLTYHGSLLAMQHLATLALYEWFPLLMYIWQLSPLKKICVNIVLIPLQ